MSVHWGGLLLLWMIAGCARTAPIHAGQHAVALRERFEEAPEFGGALYVMEAGPEDGPPLVLIHGLGTQGARDFAPLMPALARRFHVLAFDLPGLGRSSHRDDAYTPVRYASLVSALVTRHFGARPVAVLGHSMGGAIAIQFAGDHPAQVERLLLFDVAGVLHYREYLREVIAGSPQSLWTRTLAGTRQVLFSIGMFPARRMELESLALDASPTFHALFSSSRTAALLFVQHDFGPAIRSVQAPTFLGWGALDTVAPLRTAMILRSQLPVRRYRNYERSGHVPMRTEPAEVAASVMSFMDAPLVAPEHAPRPRPRRVGRCHRRRERLFEGDYDTITIHRCKGVVLRHVRARQVVIDRSEVELQDVRLESPETAAIFRHSHVRWSGGAITANVCIVTDGALLDLGGVRCAFRRESIRVLQPARFIASVSALINGKETRLHGEYQLFRTHEGALRELPAGEQPHFAQNSRSSLRPEQLAGEWLEDEDMTGASLRGANLREAHLDGAVLEGADLRETVLTGARLVNAKLRAADLRGATMRQSDLRGADLVGADLRDTSLDDVRLEGALFDDDTKFPPGFQPARHGMKVTAP